MGRMPFLSLPPTRAVLAAMTLATRSAETSRMLREMCPDGLATKSTAPAERARRVIWAPSWVRLLTMITGRGFCFMISSRVESPSLRGISTSRVTTSGESSAIFFRASSPSLAVPATSMRGSVPRISLRIFLIKDESSTTSTRILDSVMAIPSVIYWRPASSCCRMKAPSVFSTDPGMASKAKPISQASSFLSFLTTFPARK